MDIAWLIIIIAGLMEPMWVYTMERSEKFRILKWDIATAVIMIVDLYLLSVAMQTIGAGLSYAIWTGIGAISTFILGAFVYEEKVTKLRILFIFLIIAGIVGLNLASGGILNG